MKKIILNLVISLVTISGILAQDLAVVEYAKQEKVHTQDTKKAAPFTPMKSSPASFKGGNAALLKFMELNLQYPAMGLKVGKEGVVIVEFKIDSNGQVADPKIIKSLGLDFDEEVLRMVHLMPNWQPAQQGTHKIATKVRLPVSFSE
ncbi:MAG: energy transducer TonB [Bacteroidota bacterium]